jgi:uncharacterized membrane protein YqjE
VDSVRQLGAGLIALAQTRLELVTTEISADIHRAVSTLIWVFAALFFGGLTVVMLAITLILSVSDERRVTVAALTVVAFLATALIAGATVRSRLRSRPRLLGATIDELRRDREALERRGPERP